VTARDGRPMTRSARRHVVRTRADGLVALDAVTGEAVWSTPLAPAYGLPLVSDGHVVLCVARDHDRGLVLGAYGAADGRLHWEIDVPDDLRDLDVVAGRVVARTDDERITYG
jgi:outer membrane protein assembly factor BamB